MGVRHGIGCILAMVLSAGAAMAEDGGSAPEARADGAAFIPLAEWMAMARGRTLVYTVDGTFFAMERYAPAGNQVELQLSTGECLSGTWRFSEDVYCFDWGLERPACFRHMRKGSGIVIVEMDGAVETDRTQTMSAVTDAPLSCGQHMS